MGGLPAGTPVTGLGASTAGQGHPLRAGVARDRRPLARRPVGSVPAERPPSSVSSTAPSTTAPWGSPTASPSASARPARGGVVTPRDRPDRRARGEDVSLPTRGEIDLAVDNCDGFQGRIPVGVPRRLVELEPDNRCPRRGGSTAARSTCPPACPTRRAGRSVGVEGREVPTEATARRRHAGATLPSRQLEPALAQPARTQVAPGAPGLRRQSAWRSPELPGMRTPRTGESTWSCAFITL